ncbi:hypothetical protein K7432_009814 [Basidiobolus ranarum]|uniref:Uncharacterized protein n=1 Tax=Basidiobolus ranarum TaxID=34480 RepID=A0ABR2VWW9_9FUNG
MARSSPQLQDFYFYPHCCHSDIIINRSLFSSYQLSSVSLFACLGNPIWSIDVRSVTAANRICFLLSLSLIIPSSLFLLFYLVDSPIVSLRH